MFDPLVGGVRPRHKKRRKNSSPVSPSQDTDDGLMDAAYPFVIIVIMIIMISLVQIGSRASIHRLAVKTAGKPQPPLRQGD